MKDEIGFKGKFVIEEIIDGKVTRKDEFENTVMNEGIKEVVKTLLGTKTSNLDLDYMQLGTGSTSATDKTRTALVNATGGKLSITSKTIGSAFPFQGLFTTTVASNVITRPASIREIGMFFSPSSGGKMFSRVVLGSVYTLAAGATYNISYYLYLV